MSERLREAPGSGEDRIGALPEALLLHTLSLLPSEEAVRTCVLARRWRNLWKYTPSLRLIQDQDNESFRRAEHFNKFVSHLIVLRDRSPLVNCEIQLYSDDRQPCPDVQAVQLWIQYALACQVKYIFRRDVASCPIFGRLMTLLLNEWCATFDMYSLVVVLRCTPILEKLTLQICNNMNILSPIGPEGKHVPTEQSFVCSRLKVANIECGELNEKVRKIWNILRTCGVHPEKINIKTKQTGLNRFSY